MFEKINVNGVKNLIKFAEKYNKLIEPIVNKVNSIDIDNSYEHFEQGLSKSVNLSDDFKKQMKQKT